MAETQPKIQDQDLKAEARRFAQNLSIYASGLEGRIITTEDPPTIPEAALVAIRAIGWLAVVASCILDNSD